MALKLPNCKLLTLEQAVKLRERYRAAGKTVVLTNGCFDLLHTGHIHFLKDAAGLGHALFVAINADASVRALKGPARPVQSAVERAYHLTALSCVRAAIIFSEPRLSAEIRALQPDIYAKAGDYSLDTLHPGERQALEACGTDIRFLPFLAGYSTTRLIDKINRAAASL